MFVWIVLLAILLVTGGEFAGYAVAAVRYPFRLDYSEGLLWQQALWLLGPHMYGDIEHYPYMVFEYPPIFLASVRMAGLMGADMLAAGRVISIVSTCVAATFIFVTVRRICRTHCGPFPSLTGGVVASLMPFGLLPVLSWAVLMRVDMLTLAFTWGGVALAIAALRKPALLYPAMLVFVAAVFTKQIYLAAPVCVSLVWLARTPRLMVRAGTLAAGVGLAATAALTLATHGGFLRHVILYTADKIDYAHAASVILGWLDAYPILAASTLAAMFVVGSIVFLPHRSRSLAQLIASIREDDRLASFVFLLLYTAATTCTLVSAGKTGASRNYFIEWMCLWCVWIGWLSALCIQATLNKAPRYALLRLVFPALLVLQLWPMPGEIASLRHGQFSAIHARDAAALLTRARTLNGPLLSDDMVMTIQSGREVGMEPGVLLELARAGLWDERKLIALIDGHRFAAVVTAYDPGNPTFDARYLPATQAAILRAYPRVEVYGDYRMRLP